MSPGSPSARRDGRAGVSLPTRPGRRGRTALAGLVLVVAAAAFSPSAAANDALNVAKGADTRPRLPAISIIIDDLGYRRLDGLRAIELPGPIAYAILPHTPYASRLASIAFQLDKEVLLHVPMESTVDKALGPGGLTAHMARHEVQGVLDAGLASVPHVSGINNHMGSSLTRKPPAMRWVMEWMSDNGGLYFVDSLTASDSVALRAARKAGLHAIARDVFLDPTPDPATIQKQFQRLVELARAQGTGLAIGHPYPETLRVLRRVLMKPSYYGVELVSVRELIARRVELSAQSSTRLPTQAPRAAYAQSSSIGN